MLLSPFWGGQMLLSYHETGGQMLCMTTFFAVIIFVIIIIEIVIVAGFTGWRRNTCKHVRPSPATPRPPLPRRLFARRLRRRAGPYQQEVVHLPDRCRAQGFPAGALHTLSLLRCVACHVCVWERGWLATEQDTTNKWHLQTDASLFILSILNKTIMQQSFF